MSSIDCTIRQANGEDLNFIYSTWLNSFHDDSCFGRMSLNRMFYNFYRQVIDFILSKPNTKVLVSTLKEEPLVVLSYMVFEPGILHYTYTKVPFRRLGLSKTLYTEAFGLKDVFYTHQTRHVRDIVTSHKQLNYKDIFIFKGEQSHAART